ncbi:MAG: hypothetical protein JSV58_04690 [Candidatus Bathyarchaeota archaeon]|nr:MAG: hypothetical protein JSV58_04690 [Candidatus Bathyarchaeota archaeon]
MTSSQIFERAEAFIVNDRKLSATLVSYASVFLVLANLTLVHSPIFGVIVALTYLLLNGVFVGHAFFRKERLLLRLLLGILVLITFLGLASWITMTAYNLDETRSVIALFIVATLSSLTNKLETWRQRG